MDFPRPPPALDDVLFLFPICFQTFSNGVSVPALQIKVQWQACHLPWWFFTDPLEIVHRVPGDCRPQAENHLIIIFPVVLQIPGTQHLFEQKDHSDEFTNAVIAYLRQKAYFLGQDSGVSRVKRSWERTKRAKWHLVCDMNYFLHLVLHFKLFFGRCGEKWVYRIENTG